MKRGITIVVLLALFSLSVPAEGTPNKSSWNALGVLRNAKYVYVTSYDGPQFSTNIDPEDRDAISTVQNALQDSGFILVYRPAEADMVVAVQARPSSDLLVVYEAGRFRTGTYLWRAEAKNGLSGSNPVLVQQLERAMEIAGGNS